MKTSYLDYCFSTIVLTIAGLIGYLGGLASSSLAVFLGWGDFRVLAAVLCALLFFGISCVIMSRLILFFYPLADGEYSMDSIQFFIWKLYSVLYYFGCGALKPFNVMFVRPFVQYLFGARIGKNVALGGTLVDPHLIEIGDEAIIGENSVIAAHAINSGYIRFGRIVIDSQATVGVNATVMPGVSIGRGAVLLAGAVATPGTVIPDGEMWGGVPAKRIKSVMMLHN
ncbi:acyltransferase [Plasticicumulans acidivorans]|uniref:Transferase family hexapeptide repeat protein n=1 Tax=Plasticicumulans acidivorans TaxID=886464 RepID=A0A317MVX8_9GAMM|nr:DapH/DapD/GlmU-related protein [Plasticicumulans acidivorans]PWV58837.1 transferase family hexapeptide repeat protein [Plasticicumulans acidivorans]